MTDYDLTFAPVKRASFDVGRRIRFYADANKTPLVVKDQDGNVLTQPIRVPASGHLDLRFPQWPVFYSNNRYWNRVYRLEGLPATVANPLAQQDHIADTKAGYSSASNTDTAAHLATTVNAIAAAHNTLLAALEAAGVLKSS